MLGLKRHRAFDLKSRLAKQDENEIHRIHFDRLPRRKIKPMWWTITVFILAILIYVYLKHI